MKTLRIAMLVALPMAVSVQTVSKDALAATCDTTVNGSQTCNGKIKEFFIYGDTQVVRAELVLDSDTAPWGCTLNGGRYWAIGPSSENIIKSILAAQMAGKTIAVRAAPAVATCTVAWIAIK